MMMDCPRCGFTQPTDRFCASCGIDVDQFRLRPTPWWRRVIANPNTYVAAVGILLALAVLYVVTTRVPAVWRVARGTFVSSREAADPDEHRAEEPPPTATAPEPEPAAVVPASAAVEAVPAPEPAPVPARADPLRFEAEFWEVARASVAEVLSTAERIAEDREGRAYLLRDAERVRQWLRAAARPVGANFREGLKAGAQILIETPPGAAESLRFALMLQLAHVDGPRAELRFASSLSLMQAETAAEASTSAPAVRAVIETTLRGHAALIAGDTLVLFIQPVNRRPRAEFIDRAGPGPWDIFTSPNFRAGETDWIVTVRLR